MKSIIISICMIFTASALAEPVLTFSDGSQADFKWLKGPSLIPEESILQFFWTAAGSDPRHRPTSLQVEFLMPEHGHGTSPVTVTETDSGQYRISQIFLTMPGHWQLALTVTFKNGVSETQTLNLPLSLKDLGGCSK